MRKKFSALILPLLVICLMFCSCDVKNMGGIKSLTKPYINEYVCTYGMLGERNLLEDTEYIKVTFIDSKTLEVSYKIKGENKHSFECGYVHNDDTGEIVIDFGLFGAENKTKIIINDGKFSISKQLGSKLLIMVFEVK